MFRSMSTFDLCTRIALIVLMCVLLMLSGCASRDGTSAGGGDTLYDALGGKTGVARMIDEIVVELHDDPKLADLFTETDDDYFKERLNEQICMLTDGGCEYTGLDMPEAHSGMDLSPAQFNDFVEACRRAMTRSGVSVGNQNRLLAILAPMREDVIHQ